jgi:hypothetical protein
MTVAVGPLQITVAISTDRARRAPDAPLSRAERTLMRQTFAKSFEADRTRWFFGGNRWL